MPANPEYLRHQTGGPFGNSCGARAAEGFRPIADRFAKSQTRGCITFGVEAGKQAKAPRAFFQLRDGARLYLYAVWQEDWSTYYGTMEGHLVYQKDTSLPEFYMRPFRIESGNLRVAINESTEKGPYGPGTIPSDIVKQDCKGDGEWS